MARRKAERVKVTLTWALSNTIEQRKAVKAYRNARKYVRSGSIDIYRFGNGKWSWALPTSPIGQQLRADGHVCPGVKAARWFTVNS